MQTFTMLCLTQPFALWMIKTPEKRKEINLYLWTKCNNTASCYGMTQLITLLDSHSLIYTDEEEMKAPENRSLKWNRVNFVPWHFPSVYLTVIFVALLRAQTQSTRSCWSLACRKNFLIPALMTSRSQNRSIGEKEKSFIRFL